MKPIIIFALVVFGLGVPKARAQWHFHAPIDRAVTAKDLREWGAEHGERFVAIEGNIATVVNPYDHDGSARVARYRAIDMATFTRDDADARLAVFALEKVDGDVAAAHALTLRDYLRIAAMKVVAHLLLAVAIVFAGWMLLSICIFASPNARRMETTSLCAEVERRFIRGSRRW